MEYLNLSDRADDVAQYGDGDIFRYWRSVQSRRTSPNGVFGSKLFTNDFWEVFRLEQRALSLIRADYVVQLRRRDRVQQAVSYSRARLTRVWIPVDDADRSPEAKYDFEHILDSLRAVHRQEASWSKIIERTEANAITVYYEDLESNIDAAIREVARFMKIRWPDSQASVDNLPSMARQRDRLSSDWVGRFNGDLVARGLTLDEIQ